MQLNINGKTVNIEAEDNMPLLWVLRDILHMTGTKYGCGIAQCGACSVIVDGTVMRSCSLPVGAIEKSMQIETIESLDANGQLSAVQEAWIEHQVPQCGYCQSGMIMAATQLLKDNATPSDEDIDRAMINICRCGTYNRVRAAIHTAAKNINQINLTEASK
ncbi:MAG: (2Fe-2S)-binding protein [Saprospiraceae bacterium]|nr:(2Fe-2S)-binding protein [Bacteroidia bacterium]NNE13741.1 (2Fe-2S)-binding protein [Saprospiraceae bacterium]